MKCPLCHDNKGKLFFEEKKRSYYECQNCNLIFVPQQYHLSSREEKNLYDQHENNPEDDGYRKFLSRIFIPLVEKLNPRSYGLDFGCGSGPTLSVMFEERGHTVELFDHYYKPNEKVFSKTYDFVVLTEVIEHLSSAKFEIERILSLLKPGGWLGIMTKLSTGKESFPLWHYKNDPTHISFYSKDTFTWLANNYSLSIEFIGSDAIILQKKKNNF